MAPAFVTGVSKCYFLAIGSYPTVCKYPVMKLADRPRIKDEYSKCATYDDKQESLWPTLSASSAELTWGTVLRVFGSRPPDQAQDTEFSWGPKYYTWQEAYTYPMSSRQWSGPLTSQMDTYLHGPLGEIHSFSGGCNRWCWCSPQL